MWGERVSPEDDQQPEQKDLRPDRGVAQPSHKGQTSLCLFRRIVAQGELGRRGKHRIGLGSSDRGRTRLQGHHESISRLRRGRCKLDRVPPSSGPTRLKRRPYGESQGLVKIPGNFVPGVSWQRCIVHFERNVLKDISDIKSAQYSGPQKLDTKLINKQAVQRVLKDGRKGAEFIHAEKI